MTARAFRKARHKTGHSRRVKTKRWQVCSEMIDFMRLGIQKDLLRNVKNRAFMKTQ